MTTEQERYEEIERYLAGEMPETERAAFETALQQNPALAETLALHRSLQQSIGNPRRRQLLNTLSDVVKQEENIPPVMILKWSWKRWLAAAAVLAILAVVGTWQYMQHKSNISNLAEQAVPIPQPSPDSGQTAAPTQPPARPPESNRLALTRRTDFEPNPALEPLVGTFVRGGNARLTVTQPANHTVFHFANGKINFELAGKSDDTDTVILRIFNNREADFAAGKSVYQKEISVNDSVFAWKTTLKLPPGRYYILLSLPGEEEPETVLCFFAGKNE